MSTELKILQATGNNQLSNNKKTANFGQPHLWASDHGFPLAHFQYIYSCV